MGINKGIHARPVPAAAEKKPFSINDISRFRQLGFPCAADLSSLTASASFFGSIHLYPTIFNTIA